MKYGERKSISKAMRQQVFDKYNGHCAYCGRKIEMKEMQVDHIIPIAYSCYGPRDKAEEVRKMFEDESINAIDNLMPACRACNFYKGINDIERFRNRIKSELDTLAVSHSKRGWLCNTASSNMSRGMENSTLNGCRKLTSMMLTHTTSCINTSGR